MARDPWDRRSATDAYRNPAYDDALAASMKAEMVAMFERLVDEGRPIHELLVADGGIVDARLAEHYDIEGAGEIAWGDAPRGGLPTTKGFLSVHSFPFTTSPVRRGRFVLEQLLCQPKGSPPPGIEMSAPSSQAGKADASALRLDRSARSRSRSDPSADDSPRTTGSRGATPWFRPGRTLVTDGAPLASLHVAILQGLGVAIDRFGDDGEAALRGVS